MVKVLDYAPVLSLDSVFVVFLLRHDDLSHSCCYSAQGLRVSSVHQKRKVMCHICWYIWVDLHACLVAFAKLHLVLKTYRLLQTEQKLKASVLR